MKSKTKIIVLHMKEIIYTIIFAALGILLILLLILMFHPKEQSAESDPQCCIAETNTSVAFQLLFHNHYYFNSAYPSTIR